MASRIGKGEWIGLYIVTGLIDVAQYVIDFFIGPGEGFNMIADGIIGGSLFVYFQMRGASMTKRIGRLISLLGITAVSEAAAGIPSLWIIEIWYMYKSVKAEDAMEKENRSQAEAFSNNVRNYSNEDGTREPPVSQNRVPPLYSNGIGAPRGTSGMTDGGGQSEEQSFSA